MSKLNSLKNENIKRFAEAGFRLCKLGHKETGDLHTDFTVPGKVPGLGFLKTKFTPAPDVSKFPHNFGVILDANHIVFDIDPRNFPEGRNPWKEFQTDLCVNLEKLCGFYVKTGGGGAHYYFKKPAKNLIRNALTEYPGVEFKSKGRQVVGPGSIHPETLQPYVLVGNPLDLRECPAGVLEAIRREDITLEKGIDGYDDSETNVTLTRQALAAHPSAIMGQRGNDTTFQAACLCHDNGVSKDAALELLEEYNERCEPPWALDDLVTILNNAYRYGQNAIGAKNVKNDFDVVKDEQPEEKPKQPEQPAKPEFIDDIEENWVYSIGTKTFFDLKDMTGYDKEQFDDIYSGATDKKKPSAFAIGHPGMPKVYTPTYFPGQEKIIEERGKLRVNLWQKPSLKPTAGDVSVFLDFVEYLAGESAWIIHDFMAYILRNPGDKVLWAVLLQGPPGVGKSLLTRIFTKLVGFNNVSQPTNQIVQEKYNDWIKACQLVIVHELMAMGRLEMMNKLKDPITEPTLKIREMFKPTYEMDNRANFIFLTNYEDAIVLPKDDRRFAVIFSPAQKREKGFYHNVVAWMNSDGPAALLHYYLHEHKFDSRFDAKFDAPMTAGKLKMQAATMHPVQSTIMDAFIDAEFPLHGRLASFSAIMDLVAPKHRHITKIELAMHLKSCGFEPVGGRMRLKENERGRLYAIRSPEMLRDLPDAKLREIYLDQEERYNRGLDVEMAPNEQSRFKTDKKSR
jgi:hypothetical protein